MGWSRYILVLLPLGCSSGPLCEDARDYVLELDCPIPGHFRRDPYARMCEVPVLRSCVSACILKHRPTCHDLYGDLDPNTSVDTPAFSACSQTCDEHF